MGRLRRKRKHNRIKADVEPSATLTQKASPKKKWLPDNDICCTLSSSAHTDVQDILHIEQQRQQSSASVICTPTSSTMEAETGGNANDDALDSPEIIKCANDLVGRKKDNTKMPGSGSSSSHASNCDGRSVATPPASAVDTVAVSIQREPTFIPIAHAQIGNSWWSSCHSSEQRQGDPQEYPELSPLQVTHLPSPSAVSLQCQDDENYSSPEDLNATMDLSMRESMEAHAVPSVESFVEVVGDPLQATMLSGGCKDTPLMAPTTNTPSTTISASENSNGAAPLLAGISPTRPTPATMGEMEKMRYANRRAARMSEGSIGGGISPCTGSLPPVQHSLSTGSFHSDCVVTLVEEIPPAGTSPTGASAAAVSPPVPTVPALRCRLSDLPRSTTDDNLAGKGGAAYRPIGRGSSVSALLDSVGSASALASARSARSARHSVRAYGRSNTLKLSDLAPTLPRELYLPRERFYVPRNRNKALGTGAFGVVVQGELYPPDIEAPLNNDSTLVSNQATPRLGLNGSSAAAGEASGSSSNIPVAPVSSLPLPVHQQPYSEETAGFYNGANSVSNISLSTNGGHAQYSSLVLSSYVFGGSFNDVVLPTVSGASGNASSNIIAGETSSLRLPRRQRCTLLPSQTSLDAEKLSQALRVHQRSGRAGSSPLTKEDYYGSLSPRSRASTHVRHSNQRPPLSTATYEVVSTSGEEPVLASGRDELDDVDEFADMNEDDNRTIVSVAEDDREQNEAAESDDGDDGVKAEDGRHASLEQGCYSYRTAVEDGTNPNRTFVLDDCTHSWCSEGINTTSISSPRYDEDFSSAASPHSMRSHGSPESNRFHGGSTRPPSFRLASDAHPSHPQYRPRKFSDANTIVSADTESTGRDIDAIESSWQLGNSFQMRSVEHSPSRVPAQPLNEGFSMRRTNSVDEQKMRHLQKSFKDPAALLSITKSPVFTFSHHAGTSGTGDGVRATTPSCSQEDYSMTALTQGNVSPMSPMHEQEIWDREHQQQQPMSLQKPPLPEKQRGRRPSSHTETTTDTTTKCSSVVTLNKCEDDSHSLSIYTTTRESDLSLYSMLALETSYTSLVVQPTISKVSTFVPLLAMVDNVDNVGTAITTGTGVTEEDADGGKASEDTTSQSTRDGASTAATSLTPTGSYATQERSSGCLFGDAFTSRKANAGRTRSIDGNGSRGTDSAGLRTTTTSSEGCSLPHCFTGSQSKESAFTPLGATMSGVGEAMERGNIPFRSVAVKVICKMDLCKQAFYQAFRNELFMASQLHHPCLINTFGVAENQEDIFFVMDLAENGSLDQYLKKFGVTDTREMAPRFMADLILALEYLRDGLQHPYKRGATAAAALNIPSSGRGNTPMSLTSPQTTFGAEPPSMAVASGDSMYNFPLTTPTTAESEGRLHQGESEGMMMSAGMLRDSIVAHRDLKPGNLLLTWDYHIKIGDFGSSCFLGDTESNRFGGSLAYISPEVLSDNRAGPSSDLWALGCILYELLEGASPFAGDAPFITTQKIKQYVVGSIQFSAGDGGISEEAKDLVNQLLQPKPEDRIGSEERGGFAVLKQHPFFASTDWDSVLSTTNITTRNTDYTSELAEFLEFGEVIAYCSPVMWEESNGESNELSLVLVLTDLPRLFLVDPETNAIALTIPWSSDVRVAAARADKFKILTPSMTYYFRDMNRRTDLWGAKVSELAQQTARARKAHGRRKSMVQRVLGTTEITSGAKTATAVTSNSNIPITISPMPAVPDEGAEAAPKFHLPLSSIPHEIGIGGGGGSGHPRGLLLSRLRTTPRSVRATNTPLSVHLSNTPSSARALEPFPQQSIFSHHQQHHHHHHQHQHTRSSSGSGIGSGSCSARDGVSQWPARQLSVNISRASTNPTTPSCAAVSGVNPASSVTPRTHHQRSTTMTVTIASTTADRKLGGTVPISPGARPLAEGDSDDGLTNVTPATARDPPSLNDSDHSFATLDASQRSVVVGPSMHIDDGDVPTIPSGLGSSQCPSSGRTTAAPSDLSLQPFLHPPIQQEMHEGK